jgi:hypothetical protein
MKKIIYTLALCLLTGVFAYAQQNLVSNPGFETVENGEVVDWTNLSSGLTIESATDVVHSGSNSLKVSSTSGTRHFVISYVPVIPGKTYNLSVWYYLEGHTNSTRSKFGLFYTYVDEDGNNLNADGGNLQPIETVMSGLFVGAIADDARVVDLNTWRQLTLTTNEEVPANAAYIGFLLSSVQVTGYYDDASATEVGAATKQAQTINGLSDITKTVGDADFDLSATASSNLAVSYTSSNTDVATISGSTVHIVGAGTTTITASQAGNEEYEAAPDVTATLTVNPAPVVKQVQTISGLSDITKTAGDADFDLSATASSGLAVSYASSNPAVATISGSTVHIVAAGTTTITASQAGNEEYEAAPDVTATLTVNAGGSGIEEIKVQLPARTENGNLIVSAAPGNRIEVFTVVGNRLQSVVSASNETVLPGLPKGQVLIVRSGHAVAKVIL